MIIDDCSSDSSIDICQNVLSEYKGNIKTRIVRHDKNMGISITRNTGIKEAKGQYIFFVDADDDLCKNSIQLFVDRLFQYPKSEMVIGSIKPSVPNDYYDLSRYNNIDYIDDNNWVRHEMFKIGPSLPINPVNRLIQKEFIKKHELWYREGIVHEDECWMYDASKFLAKIAFVHAETYNRYYVSDSIMTVNDDSKRVEGWGEILLHVTDTFDEPFKKQQILHYLSEFIQRIDRFKEIPLYTYIYKRFSKSLFSVCEIQLAYVLKRFAETLYPEAEAFYKKILEEFLYRNKKVPMKPLLCHEYRIFRVMIGDMFKIRKV